MLVIPIKHKLNFAYDLANIVLYAKVGVVVDAVDFQVYFHRCKYNGFIARTYAHRLSLSSTA